MSKTHTHKRSHTHTLATPTTTKKKRRCVDSADSEFDTGIRLCNTQTHTHERTHMRSQSPISMPIIISVMRRNVGQAAD